MNPTMTAFAKSQLAMHATKMKMRTIDFNASAAAMKMTLTVYDGTSTGVVRDRDESPQGMG
jgi:hypothetical protein